jgi:hypothetical protein
MNLKRALSRSSFHFAAPRNVLLVLLCTVLGGCAQPYSVTLNNNVLYRPGATQRSEGVARDPGLQACLDQTLERLEQTDPARITLLACPGAGVESLLGIEALASLEQLELSDNDITDIGPLVSLKNLRVLGLRNNEIGDVRVLNELPILRFLTLEGNERIPCRQLDGLQAKLGNTLGRPARCIN